MSELQETLRDARASMAFDKPFEATGDTAEARALHAQEYMAAQAYHLRVVLERIAAQLNRIG